MIYDCRFEDNGREMRDIEPFVLGSKYKGLPV